MTNNNVLYFEGAGMDYKENEFSNVTNYRIRTAFKNLDGVAYYIELGRCPRYKKRGINMKMVSEWGLRIDHLFKLEDRHKEELSLGGYEIKTNHLELREMDYTKEAITKWINENLNCHFDTIQLLDDFYGYRVHGDNGTYHLMENIDLNHKRAKARKEAYNKVDMEYREYLNEKYSKINLSDMDNNSITIRCYASKEALKDKPREQKIEVNY